MRWERQGFIASMRNGLTDAYRVEEDDGPWVRFDSKRLLFGWIYGLGAGLFYWIKGTPIPEVEGSSAEEGT